MCLSCSNKATNCYGNVYDLYLKGQGQIWHHQWIPHVVSYICLIIPFICLSCSYKVLQATKMWWYCVWTLPQGQGQIYRWLPHIWFPINVQYISYVYLAPIRCYRLLKCEGTVYDLDLKVNVKLNITNGLFRCGFLLMFNTFHMSNLLR